MSRAEDFSAKLRTMSYENERLSSLYNSCKEELATAEKNVNLFKSRLRYGPLNYESTLSYLNAAARQ